MLTNALGLALLFFGWIGIHLDTADRIRERTKLGRIHHFILWIIPGSFVLYQLWTYVPPPPRRNSRSDVSDGSSFGADPSFTSDGHHDGSGCDVSDGGGDGGDCGGGGNGD